jgi:hypothetical protein
MDPKKAEEIVSGYLVGTKTGEDNLLKAALGVLETDSSRNLTAAVAVLHHQIPVSVSELRQALGDGVNKLISSNESLARSNEKYAKQMWRLTLGLLVVGIPAAAEALIKLWASVTSH